MSPDKMLVPETDISPATSSSDCGLTLPIPILPSFMMILSTLFSLNLTGFPEDELINVSPSDVCIRE